MIIKELKFNGVYELNIQKQEDNRGFFSRVFCQKEFKEANLQTNWVQMNISYNKNKGTIRGLHFQKEPYMEEKIVRCLKGEIWDVIVDLRINSLTFGMWQSILLSEEKHNSIYIPKGFAHGFQTLANHVEVMYMHSNYYFPGAEDGINYKDENLNINWPEKITNISKRDLELPNFKK